MATSNLDPSVSTQHSYIYRAFSTPSEIRLISLLPGRFDEPIRCHISHSDLPSTIYQNKRRITIEELKDKLPEDWWVYETVDNQIYFYYEQGDNPKVWDATWKHPDAAFDHSLYATEESDTRRNTYHQTYEALSYEWGSAQHSANASITDDTSVVPASLTLGETLLAALKHLRLEDQSRTIWIDALCINQRDNEEKTEQVKRMEKIYRQASRVIVWLGPQDFDSTLAVKTLDYLGRQIVMTTDNWVFCTPGSEEPYWCEANCKLPYSEDEWTAISRLLARTWFTRVWIIQEIQLANKHAIVRCGTDEISWSNFRKAVIILWNKDNMPLALAREKLLFIEQLARPNLVQLPISHILRCTKQRQCSNPRDFVYALMGLFPLAFRQKLRPNYNDTVSKAYADLVSSHIKHTGRLELLRECHFETPEGYDLPSWVPDYRNSKSWRKPIEWHFAAAYSRSCAQVVYPNTLEATGTRCAVVKDVQPVTSMPFGFGDFHHLATRSQPGGNVDKPNMSTDYTENLYITGETLRSVWAKIITGNYLSERFPLHGVPTLSAWESHITNDRFTNNLAADANTDRRSSFQEDYSRDLLRSRSFISTSEGYLGSGPAETKQGDIICVFLGCDSPIVLRQHGTDRFRVVGECYTRGLEDARGLLGPLEDHWTVQIFTESRDRRAEYRFLNTETGILSDDDPRLPHLPMEWERMAAERTPDDPTTCQTYKNRKTGQIIDSDPRMTLETFKSKGIVIEKFLLV